jgi:hypothetical protein
MEVNYLKRSCESLLESSKDLLSDQTNVEALKLTRLYAIQVVDLLEEKEDSFIDLLLRVKGLHGNAISTVKELMDWVGIFVQITWFDITSGDALWIRVVDDNIYCSLLIPVLTHLGFSSRICSISKSKEWAMTIKTSIGPNTGTIARNYMNHEYGDCEIVRTRKDMFDAFWKRRLMPRHHPDDAHLIERNEVYSANLKTILWRDLGVLLDVKTLECTKDNERLGEILFNRLL